MEKERLAEIVLDIEEKENRELSTEEIREVRKRYIHYLKFSDTGFELGSREHLEWEAEQAINSENKQKEGK